MAAEPADEPEIAAAEKGKFTVGGEKSQIISIYMYDLLTHKLLGDPREVGVVPGAEIDILLQPGYAVKEALYGYYTWYSPDEPPPSPSTTKTSFPLTCPGSMSPIRAAL